MPMLTPRLEDGAPPERQLGAAVGLLVLDPASWIHRRVESVAFVDATSLRRRVSIDFEVPERVTFPESVGAVVPLALLDKSVLVDFDLCDEAGATLPALTKSQNSYVSWSILTTIAEYVAEQELGTHTIPASLLDQLKVIVSAPEERALETLTAITSNTTDDVVVNTLRHDAFFLDTVETFCRRFLLLVPLQHEKPQMRRRRVLKFSYTQPLERVPGAWWRRFLGGMGWFPTGFTFRAPSVGDAATYHFEFEAPRGLEISAAELLLLRPQDAAPEARRERVIGPRLHLYVSSESRETDADVSVWLRPRRTGLVRASVASATITALVFAFFAVDGRIHAVGAQAPAALLLAIPGLIAAFIVRSGEHEMVSRVLAGVRSALAVSGLAAYVGAIIVVGGVEGKALTVWWTTLAVISVLCLISLMVTHAGLPPTGLLSQEEAGG